MDVSVIIVNYNTTELTRQSVASVYAHTRENTFEVIVVDNASTDDSIMALALQFPHLRLIRNSENKGFGRANNVGIAASTGKYVFLLNSDAYLVSDAISAFYQFMESAANANIACCGGALVSQDGSQQISYGNFPSLAEAISSLGLKYFYPSYFTKNLSSGQKVSFARLFTVDYVSGADMFIRRSALEKCGLFDEDFFLYFEETELSFRFRRHGYKCVILPEVQIVHIGGASGPADSRRIDRVYKASRNIYFKKCHGVGAVYISRVLYTIHDSLYYIYSKVKKRR